MDLTSSNSKTTQAKHKKRRFVREKRGKAAPLGLRITGKSATTDPKCDRRSPSTGCDGRHGCHEKRKQAKSLVVCLEEQGNGSSKLLPGATNNAVLLAMN